MFTMFVVFTMLVFVVFMLAVFVVFVLVMFVFVMFAMFAMFAMFVGSSGELQVSIFTTMRTILEVLVVVWRIVVAKFKAKLLALEDDDASIEIIKQVSYQLDGTCPF